MKIRIRLKSKKVLIAPILVILCIVGAYLCLRPTFFGKPDSTIETEYKNPYEEAQRLREQIDSIAASWFSGEISYNEAVAELTAIRESSPAVAAYAREQLERITMEEDGNTALKLAAEFLEVENFVQVLTKLNSVDPAHSKYADVLAMYDACTDLVLQSVAAPTSKAQFESYIRLLEDCNVLYESAAFTERKAELEAELVIFLDVSQTIATATILYDTDRVEESFLMLALGLEKYPDNELLATTLVDYRDHYIISITMEAADLCEEERYKEALQVVESAITQYDCEEFQLLRETIKEETSFLYRWKNNIIDAFNSITQGWTAEEFDVKQAAGDAEAYIVKSGKKLMLGDYSDEDVTLLSFSGNVAASLLGADVLFDLRDLSYDITHWGEDEYFAIWLAADVVALLPLIGVVKYLSHFKTAANGVNAAAELVDSVGDIGKNVNNAADMADTIKDIAKVSDNIVDVIDDATDSAKVLDTANDTVKQISKGYTLIETGNQQLLGMTHNKSGVKFVLSKLDYSDGRKLKGVFPAFDSYADIQLPKELYLASANDQKKYCMEQLQKAVKTPLSSVRKNFTDAELAEIAQGFLPSGYVWHHNEQEGLLQLVDEVIHSQTHHTGGMSLWGRGY